jgi:hypothetical protein
MPQARLHRPTVRPAPNILNAATQRTTEITVKYVLSGHPRDQKQQPHNTDDHY